jgi:predicted nucleotide-binding protein
MERQRIAEKMAADQMLNSGAFVGAVVAAVHQAFSTFAEGATSDLIELVKIRFGRVTEECAAWIRGVFEQQVEPPAYSLSHTLQEFRQTQNVNSPAGEAFDLISPARQDRDIRLGRLMLRPKDSPSQPTSDVDEPAFAENRRSVFVVHGRNQAARLAMFRFLRAIGLEPMEWSEAVAITGSATPYPGEVLDAAFRRAQAVVVLFTGDDVARLGTAFATPSDPVHERQLTPQARPNVLFEAGMAFGRHPKRTILVSLGETRPFSDVAGRHTVRLTNDAKSRHELISRLKTARCDVNVDDRTDWLHEGDFDGALQPPDALNSEDTRSNSDPTFSPTEPFARRAKLLLDEISRNKTLTGRATSNPEHRHLDATIQLAEGERLDEQRPQLMDALHELRKRTDEQHSLRGYPSAAAQFNQHYIPTAERVERELALYAGLQAGSV